MGDPEFSITLLQSVKWSPPLSLVSGCHGLNKTSLPPLHHKGGSRSSEEGRDLSTFMEEQRLEFSSRSHKNTAQIGVTSGNRDQRRLYLSPSSLQPRGERLAPVTSPDSCVDSFPGLCLGWAPPSPLRREARVFTGGMDGGTQMSGHWADLGHWAWGSHRASLSLPGAHTVPGSVLRQQ